MRIIYLFSILLLGVMITANTYAKSPYNPGDTDGDLDVDIFDYNILLQNFAKSFINADFDDNNKVDIFDYNILLQNFNKRYTANPTPSVNPTSSANPTPSPSPSSPPALTMIEGVPVCTDHDTTKWHSLVKRNADGSISCTYGHEHKDDPKLLDNVFGPVGQYTGGQEISYPWQTHSALGPENVAKHRVYNWAVVKDMPCKPSFGAKYGFKNIRFEAHSDGIAGATVRFHSYYIQAEACDPANSSYSGKLMLGGHMDYGVLIGLLDPRKPAPGDQIYIPLPGDPPLLANGLPNMGGNRRLHGTIERTAGFTWYGGIGSVSPPGSQRVSITVGISKEDWGYVDPTNPSKINFYNANYPTPFPNGQLFNGSNMEPNHLFALGIPGSFDNVDGKADGVVNYNGFTDRYGNVVASCAPVGTDCVPFKAENLPVGSYQFRADGAGTVDLVKNVARREYDVKSPVTGKSLIVYPN